MGNGRAIICTLQYQWDLLKNLNNLESSGILCCEQCLHFNNNIYILPAHCVLLNQGAYDFTVPAHIILSIPENSSKSSFYYDFSLACDCRYRWMWKLYNQIRQDFALFSGMSCVWVYCLFHDCSYSCFHCQRKKWMLYTDTWDTTIFPTGFYTNSIIVINRAQDTSLKTASGHRPLARYVQLRFAHARGMPGAFSLPPTSTETAS